MARILVLIYILLSLGRCVLSDHSHNFYFSLFERKLVHKMVIDVNNFNINSAGGGFSSIKCAANCFYNNSCIGFNLPNCQLILDSMIYQTQTQECENCKYYEMTCNELCRRHSSAFVNNELPNSYSSSCDCIINASSSNSSNSISTGSLTSISEITSEQTSTSFAITTSQISTASPNTFLSSSTSIAHGSSATLAIGTDALTSKNVSSSTDILSTSPSPNVNLNNENQLSSTLTTAALTPTILSTTFTTVTTPTAVTILTTDTAVTTPTTDITTTTVTIPTTDITATTVTTPITTSTSSTTVTTPATSTTVTTSATSTTLPTSTTSTTLTTPSTSTALTTPSTSTTLTTPSTSTTLTTPSTSTTLTTPSTSTTLTTPSTSRPTTLSSSSTSTAATTSTTHTTTVPTTAYVAPSNLVMSLTKNDWSNSAKNCDNMNHATLPFIKTATAQTEIANFIENKGSAGNGYWIGTHITMSATWVYDDNSNVTANFRPWAPGQPAQSMTCIRVYIKYEQPTKWYCDGGNTQYYYICDTGED